MFSEKKKKRIFLAYKTMIFPTTKLILIILINFIFEHSTKSTVSISSH